MKDALKILAVNFLCTLTCCVVFWLLILNKKTNKEKFEIVTSNTTYVKDTNTHKAVVNNSYTNSYPIRIIETTIPVVIDSEYVFKSYFNKYVYERTFDDSLITWKMIDTVSENRFSNFSNYTYKLKRPITTIINNYENKNKYHLYTGIRTTIATNKFQISPCIGIQTPLKWTFDIAFNPYNKEMQLSTYYTLFK